MILNFRKYGEGHPVFILHGIFGSSDNWQTLGKEFARDFKVYLIDQRNHGQSFHSDEFNYEVMAKDLLELMRSEGLEKISIIGHSMGGKTAMTFAVNYPDLIENLVVVDIAPRYYQPHHQKIFKGFDAVDLKAIKSRKEADEAMATEISDFGIRQFILKNLTRNDSGEFAWKINLGAIKNNIEKIGDTIDPNKSFDGKTLFLGGSKSDYIKIEDEVLIKEHFPNSEIKSIEGAGHWIHAEKPKELYEEVREFLL